METLTDPGLSALGVQHGFGTKRFRDGATVLCPRQVHGTEVAVLRAGGRLSHLDADAVVSATPDVRVGIVTADCVPVLVCSDDGSAVAAIHGGWRGLAAGVIEAGVSALREIASSTRLVAAIGPHIGKCCYEVDAPVLDAVVAHFGPSAGAAWAETRKGHAQLRLERLAQMALSNEGIAAGDIGTTASLCTQCDPERFHSYRRDADSAGRLVHFIAAKTRAARRSEPEFEG